MATLGHTVLLTTDVAACQRFFTEGLDLTTKHVNNEATYCELVDDTHRVLAFVTPALLNSTFPEASLVNEGLMAQHPSDPSSLLSVCVPDVSAALERLTALGGQCLVPSKQMPWGKTVALLNIPACTALLELTT